jgi:hypothetical protein
MKTVLCDFYSPDDFLSLRKKKHFEVAYRSHEFFDSSLAPPFPTRSSQQQLDEADFGGGRGSRVSKEKKEKKRSNSV